MKKLSVLQAVEVVKLAQEACIKIPGYRLGQAIWNHLNANGYKELTDHFHGTENDFYCWLDKQAVLKCFYDNYVEEN